MKDLKLLIVLSLVTLCVTLTFPVLAQPGDPGDPGDDPVPITGIEILLVAGGALGGYKLLKGKTDQKDNRP